MNELENTATAASHHLYPLISDLGLILMTAGVAILLFKKIKQPLVLGYLIAGFLAGPYFTLFPSVKDVQNVEVWAEIGVIILLFSLGLEFSFKKLMKVGGTASITALVQIVSMVFLGYWCGQMMGWSSMDSIFLGVILSISSTTIILRAFDELGVKGQKFAGIVFGALIVEDIVAILMMVLLSTVAISQQFSGMELFESVLKLLFFLILWFVGGIFFIPTLLKKAKNLLSDETLLIVSLALCLMMVILATMAGFSPALGAFIMGSIIAETTKAERIEHLIKPVKDLFGAVFFVSVGMLINPSTLAEYAIPVVVITLLTVFGKTLSSTIGTLISGQPLKQSVQTGMSLAQIGEFSFIIATLGMTLGVTSSFLYPIVVAVSAISTFTTPFMIKLSIPVYNMLEKNLPKKWTKAIESYSSSSQTIKATSNWVLFLRASIIQIIIHSVVIIAVILLSSRVLLPMVNGSQWANVVIAVVTLLCISPFLWALSLRKVAVNAYEELKKERKFLGPIRIVNLIRILFTLFFIGLLLNSFFSNFIAFAALVIFVVAYLAFPKKLQLLYDKIENRFMQNLNDRENTEASKSKKELSPWDAHMTTFEISAESNIVGKPLYQLELRERIGINIAAIKRGNITINVPNRNEQIYPNDVLYIIGTDRQIDKFKIYMQQSIVAVPEDNAETVLKNFELKNEDFIGKTIRESQLREKTNGLVVGIEREGRRMMNPESHVVLEKDDIIWIVGDKKKMNSITLNAS
ncbi:CPA2 family monovalent cation:H+ antiporter-2 [Flavobacterium gossypii]|uniref:CPA2 family monovalent cation:H+ antiporter-2 n=2 Tax=Flavobacterium TaxID=237 RepID=A0A495MLJ5_9FLAO|nr:MULTISPECIES: cation:proton antiporter [Flavobacterium]MBA9073199.1 CPA2 family monovalent cation:H+ antiporter-2 [Flavobacterium gossypii]RKS26225.1 CPA2 family monovalent cation:H+ antiporter-2 [Flavobacterium endophyticum]